MRFVSMVIPTAMQIPPVKCAQNMPSCTHAGTRMAVTVSAELCPKMATLKSPASLEGVDSVQAAHKAKLEQTWNRRPRMNGLERVRDDNRSKAKSKEITYQNPHAGEGRNARGRGAYARPAPRFGCPTQASEVLTRRICPQFPVCPARG